jgi:hypothetical protein
MSEAEAGRGAFPRRSIPATMSRMSPHLAVGLALALTGCATIPDVNQLCGTWATNDTREQWWIDGEDLRGEGRMLRDGVEVPFERLALKNSRDGHVYVAMPGEASPTEFAPIDPQSAKYGPGEVDDGAQHFAWANYEHDFPQEIHYVLAGDRLTATISGPGRENGWQFERAAPCSQEQPQ